jgi:hypothetical protein
VLSSIERAACVTCGEAVPPTHRDVQLNGVFGWVVMRRGEARNIAFEWCCPRCVAQARVMADPQSSSQIFRRPAIITEKACGH